MNNMNNIKSTSPRNNVGMIRQDSLNQIGKNNATNIRLQTELYTFDIVTTCPKTGATLMQEQHRIAVFKTHSEASFPDVQNEVEKNFNFANKIDGIGCMLKINICSAGGGDKQYAITTRRKDDTVTSENSHQENREAKFQADPTLGNRLDRITNQRSSFTDVVKTAAKSKVDFLLQKVSQHEDLHTILTRIINDAFVEPYVCTNSLDGVTAKGEKWQMNYLTAIASINVTESQLNDLSNKCNESKIFEIREWKDLVETSQKTYKKPNHEKQEVTKNTEKVVCFNDVTINQFASTPDTSLHKLAQALVQELSLL